MTNDSTDPGAAGDGFPDHTASVPGEYAPPPPPPPYPYQAGPNPYGAGLTPQDQPSWVQQPPGSTAYGQAPYAVPQGPYAPPPGVYGPPPARSTSTIVLTVLSGVATVLCCLLGLPSLVLGILALTGQATDPARSARLTRYGWITFGVLVALGAVGVVVLGIIGSNDSPSVGEFEGL